MRSRARLRPGSRCGAFSALPDLLAGFVGLLCDKGKGRGKRKKEWEGREHARNEFLAAVFWLRMYNLLNTELN